MKTLPFSQALLDYIDAHCSFQTDLILRELRDETARLGDIARMQIDPIQGGLFVFLARLIGAERILEIGTFTGYSAICFARALPAKGHLWCLDASEQWTSIARRYWQRAGVEERITLRIGDARETLPELKSVAPFDLVFIDADKPAYDLYFELSLPLVRAGGLLIFDNTLQEGRVVPGHASEPAAQAIRALNTKLATDPRVETVLLPLADGTTLCRKL
jgi:predicted O-methyltransferase YrrM